MSLFCSERVGIKSARLPLHRHWCCQIIRSLLLLTVEPQCNITKSSVWQTIFFTQEIQGCHGQGKVREKRKFFKVREKSGKIFDIVKVGEKSRNSVFRFIVHKFSSRFWNEYSFGEGEKGAAKQTKWSIWHTTPDTCSSWGQWFSLWTLSSKFLLPLSVYSSERLKMKRKILMACKKS